MPDSKTETNTNQASTAGQQTTRKSTRPPSKSFIESLKPPYRADYKSAESAVVVDDMTLKELEALRRRDTELSRQSGSNVSK
jgi:hypothetical protein